MDVRGRSQQVSGVTLQGGGVSLCLRDEEARSRAEACQRDCLARSVAESCLTRSSGAAARRRVRRSPRRALRLGRPPGAPAPSQPLSSRKSITAPGSNV